MFYSIFIWSLSFCVSFFLCPTLGHRTGPPVWEQAVGVGCQTAERPPGEAVSRALAQPPEPRREEVILDGRGGPDYLQGPLCAWKPLGGDSQTASWKVAMLWMNEKCLIKGRGLQWRVCGLGGPTTQPLLSASLSWDNKCTIHLGIKQMHLFKVNSDAFEFKGRHFAKDACRLAAVSWDPHPQIVICDSTWFLSCPADAYPIPTRIHYKTI